MSEYIYLDKLPPNNSACIISVGGDSSMIQRLEDLGIVPDTKVSCVMKSPLGDPSAFLVRGSVIAIRQEDTRNILARVCSYEKTAFKNDDDALRGTLWD